MHKERSQDTKKQETKEKSLKLDKLEEQVELLKSQLARTLADYDNLQKRVEREAAILQERITSRVLTNLLPSLDMFYDVQKHLNDMGIAMGISSFEDNLKQEGIVKIEPKKGEAFNEELHEAIDAIEGGQTGTIESVSQLGWSFLEGPVIRHAKVIVYR